MNRHLQTRPIYECRCDERLKTKAEESTRLVYTGFHGGLEHLKIETRLIDESFASVMCDLDACLLFVYYESIKRELQGIHIDGCRYNERLNSKTEGSKLLTYTGSLVPGLVVICCCLL